MRHDKPDGALETGDIFRFTLEARHKNKYLDTTQTYIVVNTKYSGGRTGHGPHDVYPDGWNVQYTPIPFEVLASKDTSFTITKKNENGSFYQSGCFNSIIDPEYIEKIGKMEKQIRFVWPHKG